VSDERKPSADLTEASLEDMALEAMGLRDSGKPVAITPTFVMGVLPATAEQIAAIERRLDEMGVWTIGADAEPQREDMQYEIIGKRKSWWRRLLWWRA
jgi:hypothetical protein